MKLCLFLLLLLPGIFLVPACSVNLTTEEGGSLETTSAYVGTYTRDEGWVNGKGEGVYAVNVRVKSGKVVKHELIKEIINPSFVVESTDKAYLYVVSELARPTEATGFLYVLDVNNDFQEVNKLSTDGKAPCHIELDQTGEFLITSNYLGGISKLFRRQRDGSLLATDKFVVPEEDRKGKSPHLHSAQIAPDNKLVAIADLGLDRVWLFTLDQRQSKLIPLPQRFVQLADGAGPRHMQWSKDGRFLYVINELNSTMNLLAVNGASEALNVLQTITTLPAGWSGNNSCADVHLHPNGNFLYGSNRGHNSIVIYSVDASSGQLGLVGHVPTEGDTPRNFSIAPSGKFLYAANQNSNSITVFSLNEKNGLLTYLDQSYTLGTPVCIDF